MAGDQSLLKRINRMAIVRHLKARPGLARSELAALTGLADSTISVLVNELIAEGWLRARDATASRGAGRRPQLLALDEGRLALLGAELGVDYLAVAACSLQGEILSSSVTDFHHRDVACSVRELCGLVAESRRALTAGGRRPLGVGVGLPGMVSNDGRLRFAPNIGWRDVAIGPQLTAALGAVGCGDLPLSVLNDANAGALGESVFGAGAATGSLAFLSVGHGIGAGIVLDERLHLGHEGLSGEVGHSVLQPDGLRCACGRRGCAETLISQKAVSRLVTGEQEPVLSISELSARLERGDAAVARAARQAGTHLGLVVHNLVVTIDPALVVLGGPLSRLGLFVESALAELARLSGDAPDHHAAVRVCRFGPSAAAVGAAASVLHQLLEPLAQRPAVPEA